jgi:hypothetical protein
VPRLELPVDDRLSLSRRPLIQPNAKAPGLQVERGLARPSNLGASIADTVPSAATTDAEFVGQGAESLELVRNLVLRFRSAYGTKQTCSMR